MEILIYLIPFVAAILLLIAFNKKMVWWEYLILIVPTIGITIGIRAIMVECNASDTEYLGTYITKITHYEDWDEMVTVHHTRQVPCGKDSNGNTRYRTEHYTTRERRYHPDKYTYILAGDKDNSWSEHWMSKEEYDLVHKRLGSKDVFRDMHRDYHRIDGDAYDTYYDNTVEHMYDVTVTHSYRNKIKADQSHTIFKHIDYTPEEAKELGLYEYPSIKNWDQNPIIGRTVPIAAQRQIKYLNAKLGKPYQFRTYILFFEDKDLEISELQKAYWQNGNKNEFIVCLGTQNDSVVWCNPFSWCDEPKLELLTRQYFIDNPKVDIEAYGKWLYNMVPGNWVRKEFSDFNYITIGLHNWQYIVLTIVMVLMTVGLSIFLVKNPWSYENRLESTGNDSYDYFQNNEF